MRLYTAADGLARDTVHCIVRDRNGFLWFGTGEGISRFDGYTFNNFRRPDGLPDRDVRALVPAAGGAFWVGTGNGVAHFDPNAPRGRVFVAFSLPGGNKSQLVNSIVVDSSGWVWAGTEEGLFVRRASTGPAKPGFEPFLLDNNSSLAEVRRLAADSAGRIWVATSNGLFLIAGDAVLGHYSRADGLPGQLICDVAPAGADMLVGTRSGIARARLHEKKLEILATYTARSGLPRDFVISMLQASNGSLWVATKTGLEELRPGERQFHLYELPSALLQFDLNWLAEDAGGDIWIGSDGAGAGMVLRNGFSVFEKGDGLPNVAAGGLALDRDGRLLVTTAELDVCVYRFQNGRFSRIDVGTKADFPVAWSAWHQPLLDDSMGSWWIGSLRGLLRLRAPSVHDKSAPLERRFRVADGLPSDDVAHVYRDHDGNIWMSTHRGVAYPQRGERTGLARWNRDTGAIRSYSEADGLPPMNSFGILAIYEDRARQMWVGLYRLGVARYRNGRFQVFASPDGVPAGGVRFLYQDQVGRLWLASGRGGLGRIDDPTADHPKITSITTADGLASDEIQAITEDNYGRIYAATGLGVDRLEPWSKRVVHYTSRDGLASGEVEDAIRDRSGDLWFGTAQGVSRFHPQPDNHPLPVNMKIGSLRINGREISIPAGESNVVAPDLPPGSNSVEVEFFGLQIAAANNLLYQRKLEGADRNWSEPSRLRSVIYTDLHPGSYEFLVRCDGPGVVTSDPATIRFRVLPHFWQRWWFIGAIAGLLTAILYLAYSYRVAHLLEVERMRRRFAQDLHDDIASGLSKIVILSEVAQRADEARNAGSLQRIAETSREVLDSVGDLVWANNSTAGSMEDLLRRMRSFATQIFEAQGVDFRFVANGVPPNGIIDPEIPRQLYMIFKEAVNNAARHSGCSRAQADLWFEGDRLTLLVRDNGIGFTPIPKPGHHGIESLRARAQNLGGSIEWRREAGTIVVLNVPIKKAPRLK